MAFLGATLFGAAAGGVAGLVRGDNYSSTSALRNFAGGAIAGGAIGAGAMGLLKHGPAALGHATGISQMMRASANKTSIKKAFLSSPLASAGRLTGHVASTGFNAARLITAHPALAATTGIMAAGALSMMSERESSITPDSFGDAEQMSSGSASRFQNSTTGLCFGMHRSRHR